jgi:myo-inositol-1(or 4)-monophosphatase
MDDLALALEVARTGAAVVAGARARSVSYKDDASPVTEVDRAAEEAMLAVLRQARPGDAVMAEESGSSGADARTWYLDPLDGTVNFINGIPQVSVSVGLWEGAEPLAAAIVDVFRGEEFTAARGAGAFADGVRLAASPRTDLGPAVVATGFPYGHRDDADFYTAALRAVLERVQGIRRLGSAALDLAWTAAGRFDGYYETGVGPWDIAAGIILVTEAGGIVTDFAGEPATPASPGVVAAGRGLHAELLELTGGAFASARS